MFPVYYTGKVFIFRVTKVERRRQLVVGMKMYLSFTLAVSKSFEGLGTHTTTVLVEGQEDVLNAWSGLDSFIPTQVPFYTIWV